MGLGFWILLTLTLVMYLGGLLFFFYYSQEILEKSWPAIYRLPPHERPIELLVHAVLILLWPVVMWVGLIRIIWEEIKKGKNKPRQ